jgi:hypothetical protein
VTIVPNNSSTTSSTTRRADDVDLLIDLTSCDLFKITSSAIHDNYQQNGNSRPGQAPLRASASRVDPSAPSNAQHLAA